MAYGDYNGPDKPDKGRENGSCNRGRYQCAPARWYNHGSFSWYCDDCAIQIGHDPVNFRHWKLEFEPKCGHPMFETRAMMDARATTTFQSTEEVFPHGIEGFGASYQRDSDQWIMYTMPGVKPFGSVNGYDKARLDWVIEALRAALRVDRRLSDE